MLGICQTVAIRVDERAISQKTITLRVPTQLNLSSTPQWPQDCDDVFESSVDPVARPCPSQLHSRKQPNDSSGLVSDLFRRETSPLLTLHEPLPVHCRATRHEGLYRQLSKGPKSPKYGVKPYKLNPKRHSFMKGNWAL